MAGLSDVYPRVEAMRELLEHFESRTLDEAASIG